MTYKSFTTPQVVLDSIIQRFLIAIPDDLTKEQIEEFKEKKLTPIRLRFGFCLFFFIYLQINIYIYIYITKLILFF